MTRRFWTLLATTGAIALSSLILGKEPAQSQAATAFYCGTNAEGLPTTIYRNSEGRTEPWIVWGSNFFADAGFNNQERCQQVSARLETYRRDRQLSYITVGRMNGEDVVCTASPVNGRCDKLIFTLKPGQNSLRTLINLLAWREGQAGAPSLFESTGSSSSVPTTIIGGNTVIDVRGRVEAEAVSSPAAAPAPVNVQPVMPQPNRNPGSLREL